MKKSILYLVLLSSIFLSAQFKKELWLKDMKLIRSEIINQEHIFSSVNKMSFINEFEDLSNAYNTDELNYWKLSALLKSLKRTNIKLKNDYLRRFAFSCKKFSTKIYITSIDPDYVDFLEMELLAINNMDVFNIINEIKKVSSLEEPVALLNVVSLLKYLKINTNKNSVKLKLKSKKGKISFVEVPNWGIYEEGELVVLASNKIPFYKQRDYKWFWSYGINYGQQMYVKFNIDLSKEFFEKMKDSLNLTSVEMTKNNKLFFNQIYDAPEFNLFSDKLINKFNKKRYKKMFIDFRGCNIGNDFTTKRLICQIKNHKRLRRKNKVYIFIDETVTSSSLKAILNFKKKLKIKIIGTTVIKTINNTNEVKRILLPNTNMEFTFPLKKLKVTVLEPDYYAPQFLDNYKLGVDAVLQYALNME